MQSPLCEAIALGEFSAWAKQLLNDWQSEDLIHLSFESSVATFCNQSPTSKNTQIVLLENNPSSRTGISLLKSSHHELVILWMGRAFTKEDLAFAIENRVYGVIEDPKIADKKVQALLIQSANLRSHKNQLAHLIHSLKGLVLSSESKNQDTELTSEMRVGLSKVEKLLQANPNSDSSIIPVAQSQGLGDALLTLAELERTGTLWVRGSRAGEEGKIDFLQGKIMFAETGAVKQLKAIYRMFCWENPRFLFNRKAPESYDSEQLIPVEMGLLVQEGERQEIRFKQIQPHLPPSELRLDFVPQTLTIKTALSPMDFHALVQVIEYHHVSDVLDYSDRWDIELYESLISLKKAGHIHVVR